MKKIYYLFIFSLFAVSSFAQRKTNSSDGIKKADAETMFAAITRDSVKLTNAAPVTMIGQIVVDTLGTDTIYIWNGTKYDFMSIAQAGNYLTGFDSLKMRTYSNLLYPLKTDLKTDSVKILQDSILVQYTKTGAGAYVEFTRDTIRFQAVDLSTRVKIDSIAAIIRATPSASSTRVASEKAVRDLIDNFKITGRTIGTAATFAALPTTSTPTGAAINGDISWLTANDIGTGTALAPQYPKGMYIYNGTSYSLAVPISGDISQLSDAQAIDKTSTTAGTTTGKQLFTVIEKYYNDSLSVDTAKFRTFSDLKYSAVRAQDWTANTAVRQNELRLIMLGGAVCVIRSTISRTTGASFDATEITNWSLVGQDRTPFYDTGNNYIAGEKLLNIGVLYERLTSGSGGNTFVASEYARLSPLNTVQSVFDSVKVFQDSILIKYRKIDNGTYTETGRDTIRNGLTVSTIGNIVDMTSTTPQLQTPFNLGRAVTTLVAQNALSTWSSSYAAYRQGGTIEYVSRNGAIYRAASTTNVPSGTDPATDNGTNWIKIGATSVFDSVKVIQDTILVNYRKIDGGTYTELRRDTIRVRATNQTATFTSLQRVEHNTTQLAITATAQTYTLTNTLQAGDLLEIEHQFNGSASERQMFWVKVAAGSTQRTFPWTDPAANTHYVAFPATLNNTFTIRQVAGGSSPRIISVKVWRDAANGFVVPTGTTQMTPVTITVNAGTNGTFTALETQTSIFTLTGMTADQEIDNFPTIAGVTLLNRQGGIFSVLRNTGSGNLNISGVTFKSQGVKDEYLGTFTDQAGDTGHSFTQQLKKGSNISTSNNIDFSLASGGEYMITAAVVGHRAAGTWRTTSLTVDGATVTFMRTGSDGSNWNGSAPLKWYVDARTAAKTIRLFRSSSTGNGNSDGWIHIERISGFVIPTGTVTKTPVTVTLSTGTFSDGTTSKTILEGAGEYIFRLTKTDVQNLSSVTATSGTVSVQNAPNGTFTVSQTNAGGNITVTPTLTTISTTYSNTAEINTGETWHNGKTIFKRTYTGTTPNNASDNILFTTVTGVTEIVNFEGTYTETNGRVASLGTSSGSIAHGAIFHLYLNGTAYEGRWYNGTGDTRHQNTPYRVTVYYTK